MSQLCALAADTKVETPEGAMTVKGVAGKAMSVFTRDATGRTRFRQMINARQVGEAQPMLKVTLETGATFRVGPDQIVYKKGMAEVRAAELHVGDDLEAAHHYPDGYDYHDLNTGERRISTHAWRVTKIEPAGQADVFSMAVNKTGNFFLAAGVLCKAEGAA